MQTSQGRATSWLFFVIGEHHFGLEAPLVRELVALSEGSTHRTGLSPAGLRGVCSVRGALYTLIDGRHLIGLSSAESELATTVSAFTRGREAHRAWLAALEHSARTGEQFTLPRDPHTCAFGRWYDDFRTDDAVLGVKMIRFDAPHQRIHALADEVCGLVKQGQRDAGLRLIEEARGNDLARLLALFDETMPLIAAAQKEVAILFEGSARRGIIVDDVLGVVTVLPADIQSLDGTELPGRIGDVAVGIVPGDASTVFLLDHERTLHCAGMA